ncbi:MAG: hypothetical protein GXO82_05850 [Chlorobi bacterium]|nr:hypothetical protein [Chlorobiota bacterium]
MKTVLSQSELQSLFQTVFAPGPEDRVVTFLVDVPSVIEEDSEDWKERRRMAMEWWADVLEFLPGMGMEKAQIMYYANVGKNNADLPETVYEWKGDATALYANTLPSAGRPRRLVEVLDESDIVLAPTEYSATAPLKMLAKKHRFRGATMPGFLRSMVPALGIDYQRVHERIMSFKQRLDEAESIDIVFDARGKESVFHGDLRFRAATPSSGMFHRPGIVGNLPSGETYIVPYEGEKEDVPSESRGEIPVQFGDEIVVYRVENNVAVEVLTDGVKSAEERAMLEKEPAYGNIAEIGFGVLGDFGMNAVGSLLMDEKLGLHIAFGRSEHFGGIVSPGSFRDPNNVVHIDRVYVPSLQPEVTVASAVLNLPGKSEVIMTDGKWVI